MHINEALDSLLPDGSSTLFFISLTISLADFKGKIQSGSCVFNCETNCNTTGICDSMTQMLPHSKEQISVTLP